MAFNVMVDNKNRSKINGLLNVIVLYGITLSPTILKFAESTSYFIFALHDDILNIMNLISYSKLKTKCKNINFIK